MKNIDINSISNLKKKKNKIIKNKEISLKKKKS
jgi:hypothetical protein